MVRDLENNSILHLRNDIALKLTLGTRAVLYLLDELLVRLRGTSILHVNKTAALSLDQLELIPPTTTRILHDEDRRIIDLIRMARNADVSHFARHMLH